MTTESFVPRLLADGGVCCSASHALCDKCKSHHGIRTSADGDKPDYTPPDGYAIAVAKLRGAPPAPPPPPKDGDFTPPDSYAAGIAKMQKEQR